MFCRGKDEDQVPDGLPPKVVEVYRSVGKIMSRYSAGKVPKAFKIIPNLKNWEEVSSMPAQTACPAACQPHVKIRGSVMNSVRTVATSLHRHRREGASVYARKALCCGMQGLHQHSRTHT